MLRGWSILHPGATEPAGVIKEEAGEMPPAVVDLISSDSSSDESESSSTASSESVTERELKVAKRDKDTEWERPLTWVHKKSQVRHLVRFTTGSGSKIFMRGRASSGVFVQATSQEPPGAGAACPHGGKHSKQVSQPMGLPVQGGP